MAKKRKTKTKRTTATKKYGARYGKSVRAKFSDIETQQRKKQTCPFCKKTNVKRQSKGVYLCKSCKKKFTSGTFYVK